MKHKKKKKLKKKKGNPSLTSKYQYGGWGGTGSFDLSALDSIDQMNIDLGNIQIDQGQLTNQVNQGIQQGQMISAMSGLADMQNNPGIQKLNLAQATVNPNRGFGAAPYQMGGAVNGNYSIISKKDNTLTDEDLTQFAADDSKRLTSFFGDRRTQKKLAEFTDSPKDVANGFINNLNAPSTVNVSPEIAWGDGGKARGSYNYNNKQLNLSANDGNRATITHEVTHKSDQGGRDIPEGEIKRINELINRPSGATGKYLSKPNEVRARVLSSRKLLEDIGIGKMEEDLSSDDIDKVFKYINSNNNLNKDNMSGFKELMGISKGKTNEDKKQNLRKLLNEIVSNEQPGDPGVAMAQMGGEIGRPMRGEDPMTDMALRGYSDNSPYGNSEHISIPGNNIDMSNTSRPIIGIPDNGKPKLMAPNSGAHTFPGASMVVETPFKMEGSIGSSKKKYSAKDVSAINLIGDSYFEGLGVRPSSTIKEDYTPLLDDPVFKKLATSYSEEYNANELAVNIENMDKSESQKVLDEIKRKRQIDYDHVNSQRGKPRTPKGNEKNDQEFQRFTEYSDYQQYKKDRAKPTGVVDRNAKRLTKEMKNKSKKTKIKKYQMGGMVGQEEAPKEVEVQTEKGEMIMLPDGSIVKVKAKKLHKHMKDSQVTDVLKEGTYVASNDKSTSISQAMANAISLGYSQVAYDELDDMPAEPKELLFGDIFGKAKKLVPAQIAKRIKSKFKLTDREDDAFATKTKEENLSSRMPYTMTLQAIAEGAKGNTGPEKFQFGGFTGNTSAFMNKMYGEQAMGYSKRDNAMMDQMDPYGVYSMGTTGLGNMGGGGAMQFRQGGQVPKYQSGGADPISAAINFAGDLIGHGVNYFAKKKAGKTANGIMDGQQTRIEDNYNQTSDEIAANHAQNSQNLNMASGLSAMNALSKNPYENREDLSQVYTSVGAMQDSIPQHLKNFQLRQLQTPLRGMTNSAMKYSGNYGNTMANMSEMYGKQTDAMSGLMNQQGMQGVGLANQKTAALMGVQSRDASNLANQMNNMRNNSNAKGDEIARAGVNHLNGLSTLNNQNLASNFQNRGAYNAGMFNVDQGRMSAAGIQVAAAGDLAAGASTLGQMGSGIYNAWNQNNNNQNQNNNTASNGYGPYSSGYSLPSTGRYVFNPATGQFEYT